MSVLLSGGWDAVFQPVSKTCLISNAALLALEKRANDSTADSISRGESTKSKRGQKKSHAPYYWHFVCYRVSFIDRSQV